MIAVFALISVVGAASINQHGQPVPMELVTKIGQIFHDMDVNGDFFISKDEISLFFTGYDQDMNGIDLSEFKQSWDYKDTDSQKEHNFNQMDKNADGVLTDYDLALIFLTADTNQDGVIDFNEFDIFMRASVYNNIS
ncbi:uncharacterized protein LOC125680930 [Ostrea edulis]|uniref:uncharacterized protein LOC125680930 n=1 Tax=Ostrea edulis TaxID=37623 RepID=UPI00209597B7|nr:uncharacterized protein LOC125680930 [Ostrea edulis]XP_056009785.1 uncharacterized protein LOC125680930 [Ostrea edulis]